MVPFYPCDQYHDQNTGKGKPGSHHKSRCPVAQLDRMCSFGKICADKRLTTVDVDIAMMASEGVELLLERLNDKRETFVRRVVSGHIVIRKSTGKAATEP